MSIEDRFQAALDQAWERLAADEVEIIGAPDEIARATEALVETDSAPARAMAFAIAAGTAEEPHIDPGALQEVAGVDRRGQATRLMEIFTPFRDTHGLTIKVSKEAGVSNPWRVPVIDDAWLQGRRLSAAPHFLSIVNWLRAAGTDEQRSERAQELLEYLAFLVVRLAARGSFAYPRFKATPALAMDLVMKFLNVTPNRPDAIEAVVSAAARAIAASMSGDVSVERGDTNSPDAIDVLIVRDGEPTGIEVTDEALTPNKILHEVVPAMLTHGLSHVTIVARPPAASNQTAIAHLLKVQYQRFEQRIDISTVEDIGRWLAMPALRRDVATRFLWQVGVELDQFSNVRTRRAWLAVLNDYRAGKDD